MAAMPSEVDLQEQHVGHRGGNARVDEEQEAGAARGSLDVKGR